jgi:two-component system, OmpR family, sensor histidine kinase CiaH
MLIVVGITGLLLLVVTVVLYRSLADNVASNVEGNFATEEAQAASVARTVASLRRELLVIDGAVLALVSVGGFAFARRSLKPIWHNVEAQKRFVSNASHDLRTPLAAMKANLEVGLHYADRGSDPSAAMRSSLEEVDRMSRIVEDMLTLSRIDAHQEQLFFTPTDVGKLLEDVAAKMQMLAQSRGLRLSLTTERLMESLCDGDHLRRAFGNVVLNAIEHSGDHGSIEINARREGNHALVSVRDHGIGIADEDLRHLFERFYRAGDARSRDTDGTGLGLAIAQWIVQEHGGSIGLASISGQGTTVTISLPLVSSS